MKKLMVVALVAFAAVCANAASIKWTITGVAALPDGTAASTAMKAYWIDGSNWEAFNQLSDDKVAAYVRSNGTIGTTTSGSRGVGMNGVYGDYAAKAPVSGFFVILSTDADNASYYAASSELYSNKIPDNAGNLTPSFDFAAKTTGWKNVPEPTSGLLMLLGMAGLALRRRRA